MPEAVFEAYVKMLAESTFSHTHTTTDEMSAYNKSMAVDVPIPAGTKVKLESDDGKTAHFRLGCGDGCFTDSQHFHSKAAT